MEQLAIFDAAGTPIAPPHAAGARRERVSDSGAPRGRNSPTPLARNTDPDTSHQAAARAQRFAEPHRARILGALALGPANIFEIARLAGMNHVAVARRLPELQRAGLARPTEDRRDGCRVWALCR